MYGELEFFDDKAYQFLDIENHFNNLKLKGKKRYYFLGALIKQIEKYFYENLGHNDNYTASFNFIIYLYNEIGNAVFPKKEKETERILKMFDFEKTKNHVESLPDNKKRIKYLIEQKTNFNQQRSYNWSHPNFSKKCDLEIKKWESFFELERQHEVSKIKPQFQLSSVLSKIDYIRIINALVELRCFAKEDETLPDKIDVMKTFGNLVGINLNNYDKDLNKAFTTNVTMEKNLEIFDKMKTKTQDIFLSKLNKAKK